MELNSNGGHEQQKQLADLEQIPIGTRVEFLDAQIVVSHGQKGNRVITIIDLHTATAYQMELAPDACRMIGRELVSVIDIAGADQMPPERS
jgi:hypothetical protein